MTSDCDTFQMSFQSHLQHVGLVILTDFWWRSCQRFWIAITCSVTDNVDFSSYSVNFVTLASHALVESSIFFGDTFKFKLCMCDSERLLGRFAIFAVDSGDSGD